MSVTLTTAEAALKDFYLDVVADQLNMNTNPLYNKIKSSQNHVVGKNVIRLARVGLNGGIGAGSETGNLPTAAGNQYVQMSMPLKNLYGQIEISDKAIQASKNGSGAFVNLLNDEMEGLLKASKFNFARMLFGDGTGKLTDMAANTAKTDVVVASVKNLMVGMVVDIVASNGTAITNGVGRRIGAIDRATKTVSLDSAGGNVTTTTGHMMVVQGSFNYEITGLGAIFDTSNPLYSLNRTANSWTKPYISGSTGTLDDVKIQLAIDNVEEASGSNIDFIVCSYGVRRNYQNSLAASKRNIDVLDLQGGFKAISYNGIPVYADRFCPDGTMYLLDTSAFTLHQLCDWRWLEDGNGRILRQSASTPKFTATLVKYAELMCDMPAAQAALTGCTEVSAAG